MNDLSSLQLYFKYLSILKLHTFDVRLTQRTIIRVELIFVDLLQKDRTTKFFFKNARVSMSAL